MIADGRFDRPETANVDLKELQRLFPATMEQVRSLRTQKQKETENPQRELPHKSQDKVRTQVHAQPKKDKKEQSKGFER